MAQGPANASPNEPRRDVFGVLLRAHRLAAGLTQEDLAERAGLSLRAIQNLERGDRRPYADSANRLVAALSLEGDERAAFELAARPQPRAPAEPRAPARGATLPTNLPTPLTACIGREAELVDVRRYLANDAWSRSLVPAGRARRAWPFNLASISCTMRRARRCSRTVSGWSSSTPSASRADPHTLASAVGVYEEPGRRLIDTIADALFTRKLLVVLDNCEHLLAQSAVLVDMLLGRCPTLRVLATSRQPLALPGEVVRAAASPAASSGWRAYGAARVGGDAVVHGACAGRVGQPGGHA